MLKRIADTVIATALMLGVALVSPFLIAAYKEAKRNAERIDYPLDKQKLIIYFNRNKKEHLYMHGVNNANNENFLQRAY